MDITAYLNRINFIGEVAPDFASLCQLQRRHLMAVPYENLDIMRDIPLSLETDALYEKIVTRGRGGYCFELNGLFAWLLREIGFGVTEYFARFLRNETEIPMRRHRVLRVTCANGAEYLADVGVGQIIPREPLPFTLDEINEQGNEQYKLVKDDFLGYVLYEFYKGGWRWVYSFTLDPQVPEDFEAITFYCERYPESFFRTMDMVHLFTENGRKLVAGREFKVYTPEGVQIHIPASEGEYTALLEREFGIRL
ncbi:MAG: arylamine N-acetyltransferase [Defluviitaleaceae bacterium]|nr:arylamine N-acetyltransferase [Defluviitaleaceae bacterium]